VSSIDPLGDPTSTAPIVRRRDLREPSTRSSRKDARKRAEARRKSPSTRPSGRRSAGGAVAAATKPPLKRRVGTKLFAIVSLSFAALLIVGTSIPSSLFAPVSASASSTSAASPSADVHTITVGQTYKSSGVATDGVSREGFKATSEDVLAQLNAVAADAGYTVNNSGPIRWPFDAPVPLGDLFGPRVAPCSGCSTFHNGTDFETGDKAPVYAVAAGTVTVSDMDGSLGQNIAISHSVNGLVFTSVYGHLTAGSEKVQVGDTITEGELIGLTGSTGASTGPHLFLEIDIDGSPVDSLAWMKAHTAH
jgi:murein DD-endopeptidase MepM/ murein hydrolase activator NlpD